jgi:L-amino acid N-acyltransferase YncA
LHLLMRHRLASAETAHYRLRAMNALLIRPSDAGDVPAMTAIYAHAVLHGSATFELEPPDEGEMARRRDDVLAKGLPWLAAERGGKVLGYAYSAPFRPRPAYRFCLEDSIYLDPVAHGQGIGRLMLAELLAQSEARGARQMLAVIGDSANAASIGVHRACGFDHCGVLHAAGWKFGRWIDVVLMQRSLGEGASTAAVG